MFRKVNKVHFVGIGGIGMSGIAELLLNQGFNISGSDVSNSEIIDRLRLNGAKINIGHKPENLLKSEAVVYSSAIPEDNVELIFARERGIPTIKRAEMLGELIALKSTSIAVGGTHGKTSTSSMIGAMLTHAKLDPTLIVGGLVKNLNSNSKLGSGDIVVVEADEYDKSFLQLNPTIAIITNIEEEHMDCYNGIDDLYESFISFANSVPFYGSVIICSDSKGANDIINKIKRPITTYGIKSNADVSASMISFDKNESFYTLSHQGKNIGQVSLSVPGEHNIFNSLAAAAIGFELGINPDIIISGLESYQGVRRRFEIKGTINKNNIIVIDDYAHHPTEVYATLITAKESWNKKIIGVFQPHLFTRTRDFSKQFAEAMMLCDVAMVTDIYPAREKPITGVTGKLVYDGIIKLGHKNAYYIPDLNNLNSIIEQNIEDEALIITMGAGTIWRYGESILKHLSKNHE